MPELGFEVGEECFLDTTQPIPNTLAYNHAATQWAVERTEGLTYTPKAKDYDPLTSPFESLSAMPEIHGTRTLLRWIGAGSRAAYPVTTRIEVVPSMKDGRPYFGCSCRFTHWELTEVDGVVTQADQKPVVIAWQSYDNPVPANSVGHLEGMIAICRSFLYRSITLGVEGQDFLTAMNQGLTGTDPSGQVRTDAP